MSKKPLSLTIMNGSKTLRTTSRPDVVPPNSGPVVKANLVTNQAEPTESQGEKASLTLATAPPGKVQTRPAPTEAKITDRVRGCADLIVAYARLSGVDTSVADIAEVICKSCAKDEIDAGAMVKGLTAAGLSSEISTDRKAEAEHWPALAYMTSGQFVLVLGQACDQLEVYDTTQVDNRAHVSRQEFEPFFTGVLIHAERPLEMLAHAHAITAAPKHWFWGEFYRFRRQCFEVALGSFVANLLAVSVALFSLQVYDRVIPHQSEATLWVLAVGAGMALLLEALLKIARARLMDGAGRQVELNVQRLLMDRILGMRSDVRSKSPSALFSSMREFGSVREFFTTSTISTIADIPFIFVFLLLVSSIAGNVVWVLVVGALLMIGPGFLLQKRMMRLTQETQGASSKSSRLLHEAVFELDTIKTQRGEDRFRRVWSELTTLLAIKSSDQRKLASILTFWSQGVQQATYVVAVIVGTYLVFAGQFTVGSIIAVGILTSRTLAPLTQLAGTMARWGNVKAALDGLDRIAHSDQDTAPGRVYLRREGLTGRFELKNVSFRYEEDGPPTLDIPALVIRPGQCIAVLGSNGSGKSTLLKMLSGLYAPEQGRVLLDGTDIGQIEPRDLRRAIGYLGQDVRLFAGTLRENLNLNMLECDDRLIEALQFSGLGPFVSEHHKGLDLEILDGGKGLSIGQRQSIGWARIWLQDPAICLLDEPTAALDQTLERTLCSRLEQWLDGRTTVIATHRIPILGLTNRTMILQNGRLTMDGPRDQVLAHLSQVREAR